MAALLERIIPKRFRRKPEPVQAKPAPVEVNRKQAAYIKARFDAAQTSTENENHWSNADYLGPRAEITPNVRRILRSRARYEAANNTYCAGMLKTLASDTIGTGPALQITDPNISQDDAAIIEERFWQWARAIQLGRKLRTMRMAKARDGETFAIITTNPRSRDRVKLDMQVIEADQVSSPAVDFTNRSASLLTDGIIYDDFGNVVAYTVLREHPGDGLLQVGNEFDIVPASEVIHLYNEDRAGQGRGIPEITPALPLYAMLRRYTLAVVRSAELAALISWVIQTQMNPESLDEAEPFDVVDTERGMGMTLPAGWNAKQFEAEQPTGTYADFKHEVINEIARCLCMPYNVAAGNSSSYNYASGRLDHRSYYKSIRVERADIDDLCIERLFEEWWSEASLLTGYLPERFYLAAPPMHEWRWDGDEHVDPTKEADAALTRIKSGLTTNHDECAKLGTDASVVQAKQAAYLGMSLEDYQALQRQAIYGAAPPAPAPNANQPDMEEDDGEET